MADTYLGAPLLPAVPAVEALPLTREDRSLLAHLLVGHPVAGPSERYEAEVLLRLLCGEPWTCRHCGASLVHEPGVGLVDTRSGDDGGTYDVCPSRGIDQPHEEAPSP